jgi:hypothetical protein
VIDAAGEIYGDAPNVAARVQALAEPGTVVVTAQVQRQVVALFVAEDRGSHELKGVPEPVTLFRLVRASGGGRRAGQRHLTPLIGRDEEIAMLMQRWERARQGEGQLVLIVGKPGVGKSRLIEEFHGHLRETRHPGNPADIASVVGRDFSYVLLRTVAGVDDMPLQAALDRLAEADILLVQGLPPPAATATAVPPPLR